jgi:type II secretory pathway component PulJ
MKTAAALALTAIAGVIAFRFLPHSSRDRLASSLRHRMLRRMEHMMTSLPEGAPPKLVMSILPRLKAQNDQIIALLREQSELIREQARSPARH